MCRLLAMSLLFIFLCLSTKEQQPTIYIIGDSTAANKLSTAYPETGWGMEFHAFFSTNVRIENRAVNGRSTKSFLNEKRWESILTALKAGDYVFIQFGHNDEKIDKPETGTSLEDYKLNLTKYVKDARAKNATPILMTPIMRRSFKNGLFVDSHGGYPNVVRKLADSLQVPMIDMHQKTEKLIVEMGEFSSVALFNHVDSGHVNYPAGKIDNTHLSPKGAKVIASLVAQGVKELNVSLAKYLISK